MLEREYSSESPRPLTVRSIFTEEQLAAYQQIANEFRVDVSVIARAGEQYTHVRQDPETERETRVTSIVPDGKVYVRLTACSRKDRSLEPFYEKARAILAQRTEGMTK